MVGHEAWSPGAMSYIGRRKPICLRRLGISLAIILLVQACTAQVPDPAAAPGVAANHVAADVPRGAIQVGDELYQVPIGTDDDGCPMYRMHSPTRLVAQAIYYHDGAGGFTTDKREAACASALPD